MNVSSSGDETSKKRGTFWDRVHKMFTSVRLALFLLFALAISSVLGTVVPQEITSQQLRQAQESFLGRLGLILDIHQVYRSWWFLSLLVLLCLNLIGCLRKRTVTIFGDWSGRNFKETFILSLADTRPTAAVKKILIEAIGSVLRGSPRIEGKDDEYVLNWGRHRAHLLGFPLIHLAIIIILLGALAGLLFGFKGAIQIREGSSEIRYTLIPSGQSATLPFEIALDKFYLSYYPSGEPREYRSEVRLIKNGKEVYKGSIRVNHPVTYDGISLYQSDYKLVSVKGVTLKVEYADGSTTDLSLIPGENTALPGGDLSLRLVALDPGPSIRGPSVDLAIGKVNEEPQLVRMFQKDPKPIRAGDYQIQFKGYQPLYASGLQINYDPGAYLVWGGCIMLMAGFFVTLFMNYRRVRVHIVSDGPNKTLVRVSVCSRRKRREFREAVEKTIRRAIEGV